MTTRRGRPPKKVKVTQPEVTPPGPAPAPAPSFYTLKADMDKRAAAWRSGECPNFVPPVWVEQVVALGSCDEGAIRYLTRICESHGRLSIQHALFFLGLEATARAASEAAFMDAFAPKLQLSAGWHQSTIAGSLS